MRKLPLGLTISAAVHAAVVVWIATYEPTPDPADHAPPPLTPIEIVTPAPAPVAPEAPAMDVAFLDPATTAAIPALPPAPVRPTRKRPRLAAVEPGRSTGAAPEAGQPREPGDPGAPPAAPARSSWFAMRTNRLDLALPGTFRDDLDHAPAGTSPAAGVADTGQLAPSGGGTFRSDQGTFVARVARDGSVSLKDSRNLNVRFALPRPKQIGNGVTQWYRSDKGPDGQRGEQTLKDQVTGSIDIAKCDVRDNACAGDRSKAVVVPVLRGGFDVTDWLMRRNKNDPYASKKLAFLDSTRDERVELGRQHRAEQLRQTAVLVQRNLDRLWAAIPDPAARKQALFELWDEIVEADGGDEVLAQASRAARKQVIGFIRARLPPDSRDAYTLAEITAHNRKKQSKASFAPYD